MNEFNNNQQGYQAQQQAAQQAPQGGYPQGPAAAPQQPLGYQGYQYGPQWNNPYMANQTYQAPQNINFPMNSMLTAEQEALLKKSSTSEFYKVPNEMEIYRAICNHKHAGTNKAAVVPNPDGTVTCTICGRRFRPLDADTTTESDVNKIVEKVNNLWESIKLYWGAVDPNTGRQLFPFTTIIDQLPNMWKQASNYVRHAYSASEPTTAPGYSNPYDTQNMMGSLYSGAPIPMGYAPQGYPQAQSWGMQGPMGYPQGPAPVAPQYPQPGYAPQQYNQQPQYPQGYPQGPAPVAPQQSANGFGNPVGYAAPAARDPSKPNPAYAAPAANPMVAPQAPVAPQQPKQVNVQSPDTAPAGDPKFNA